MIPLRGYIEVSERGTWVADLTFPEAYEGVITFGGDTWTGVAVSTVQDAGSNHLTIVGGNGKLGTIIPEKWYQGGGTGNTIARDIFQAIGEQATVDLPARAPQYLRAKSKGGEALDVLCDLLGANWWADRAGQFHVGTRPATAIDELDRVEIKADTNHVLLSVEKTAGIEPGMTWKGKVVRHVRWVLSETIHVELSFLPFLPLDSRASLDYYAPHKAVVHSQAANKTLSVTVDGRYSLTQVTWLPGVAAEVLIQNGDLVTIGFWAGDPRQPFALGLSTKEGPILHRTADGYSVGTAGNPGTQAVALAPLVSQALSTLKDAISNAVTVPNDGGASLKTTILAALSAWPPALESSNLKAE